MAMTTMRTLSPFTPSDPADPGLRAQAEREGYVFLPGLLPVDDLLAVREQVLGCCRDEGHLDPAAALLAGIPVASDQPLIEADGDSWRRLYRRIQALRTLHAMNRHPRLLAVLGTILGAEVQAHPRCIARVMWPGTARFSTPPHQDHFYIGGTLDTWTAWIPLGDCPEVLGGLAVAPGSHRLGPMPVHRAEGAGGHGVDADTFDWVGGDFHCSDVLLMHSLCVHQGRDNRSDRLRLSIDYRYQRMGEAIETASLQPHMGWWNWNELTADWPSDDPLRAELRSIDAPTQSGK